MKYTHLPVYGHAMCPHCCKEFDLTGAQPSFAEKCPHNDYTLYVLCPQCANRFQHGSSHTQKAIGNRCFVNFKLNGRLADGRVFPWAVTTTLTLALNSYDLLDAVENGHGLSRTEYFGICAGQYEVCQVPGGLCVVMTTNTGDHNEPL